MELENYKKFTQYLYGTYLLNLQKIRKVCIFSFGRLSCFPHNFVFGVEVITVKFKTSPFQKDFIGMRNSNKMINQN